MAGCAANPAKVEQRRKSCPVFELFGKNFAGCFQQLAWILGKRLGGSGTSCASNCFDNEDVAHNTGMLLTAHDTRSHSRDGASLARGQDLRLAAAEREEVNPSNPMVIIAYTGLVYMKQAARETLAAFDHRTKEGAFRAFNSIESLLLGTHSVFHNESIACHKIMTKKLFWRGCKGKKEPS